MKNQMIEQTPSQPAITPTSTFLFHAERAFSDQKEAMPGLARLSHELVLTVLAAATANSFKQSEILETMLARGEQSDRVEAMAEQACVAAGISVLHAALERFLSELLA